MLAAVVALLASPILSAQAADPDPVAERFTEQVEPTLEIYCYACHGLGAKKGGLALDQFDQAPDRLRDPALWLAVLKNVRAGVMPPPGKPRPSDEELEDLQTWIKADAFGIDPAHPDPGRVTVRRLNRVEYRNTIRDLLGVDFNAEAEFPPDDAGHGFDNVGDALSISPLLMEKYIAAAQTIIEECVPTISGIPAEQKIAGARFQPPDADNNGRDREGSLTLSYYEPASVSSTFPVEADGHYQLVLDMRVSERYIDDMFDLNRCRLSFTADGQELYRQEFSRQEGHEFELSFEVDWKAGEHTLAFELEPLTPEEKQVRSLAIRVQSVKVLGPMDEQHLVPPPNYTRFFPGEVPADAEGRRRYAREILQPFATRAFRRRVGEETLDRLVTLAESVYSQQDVNFETGIAQAMTAVLASPRFLFREEGLEPESGEDSYPLVDEYALASRLSYFLWATMPDDELIRLAEQHKLRENLDAQLARMLADERSDEFIRNFTGQWLQARDIESVPINAFAVLSRDRGPDPEVDRRRARFRELSRKPREELTDEEKAELDKVREAFFQSFRRFREFELDGELRRAMRQETEMGFARIVREDRSLLELIDSDTTFLNERLAKHYGIVGVSGDQMRLVELPADSPRGGVLTQGTVLAVTSNPDRTSPVKRGLFILENILGSPPAPPPPDIPPLEDADKAFEGRTPTLRETLAVHRAMASCSSCHDRMDPLGLAFENFNALGMWRDKERNQPIDTSGTLITGESFQGLRELKDILTHERRQDFYRCLSEKMLTYSLGRGLEYHDVHVVDELVARLERDGGKATTLIKGIVESAPFQRSRRHDAARSAALKNERENHPARR